MITAIFNPDTTMANAYGLWQYDYGQTLRIQGLNLPSAVEIHFSLQESGGDVRKPCRCYQGRCHRCNYPGFYAGERRRYQKL